jgi:hypothetical protein
VVNYSAFLKNSYSMKKLLFAILAIGFLASGLSACYHAPKTSWTPKAYKKKKLPVRQ